MRSKFDSYAQRFKTPQERFLEKASPANERGCTLWNGSIRNNYGQFSMGNKTWKSSRAAWVLFKGEIPVGGIICHHCDEPLCVNLEHLYVGSYSDNMRDKVNRGRNNPVRGERCHFSKLTESDVKAIRESEGSCKFIGAKYGIGAMQVSRIRRGLRWSHV